MLNTGSRVLHSYNRHIQFVIPEYQSPKHQTEPLPKALRAALEYLSGYELDAVRVCYHSQVPALFQARAIAFGTTIHLTSGAEDALAHEAWHIVQQAQGRVKATESLHGFSLNNEPALEAEADRMGTQALLLSTEENLPRPGTLLPLPAMAAPVVQRMSWGQDDGVEEEKGGAYADEEEEKAETLEDLAAIGAGIMFSQRSVRFNIDESNSNSQNNNSNQDPLLADMEDFLVCTDMNFLYRRFMKQQVNKYRGMYYKIHDRLRKHISSRKLIRPEIIPIHIQNVPIELARKVYKFHYTQSDVAQQYRELKQKENAEEVAREFASRGLLKIEAEKALNAGQQFDIATTSLTSITVHISQPWLLRGC